MSLESIIHDVACLNGDRFQFYLVVTKMIAAFSNADLVNFAILVKLLSIRHRTSVLYSSFNEKLFTLILCYSGFLKCDLTTTSLLLNFEFADSRLFNTRFLVSLGPNLIPVWITQDWTYMTNHQYSLVPTSTTMSMLKIMLCYWYHQNFDELQWTHESILSLKLIMFPF